MIYETKRRCPSLPISFFSTLRRSSISIETYSSGKVKPSGTFLLFNSDVIIDKSTTCAGDVKQMNRGDFEHRLNAMTPQRLPNEILALIINHLDGQRQTLFALTLINKYCYTRANPLLWKVLELDTNNRSQRFITFLSGASQQRLSTLGQYVKELYLDHSLMDIHLIQLLPHIPFLEHLSMYYPTRINDTSIQHPPFHFTHNKSLQRCPTQFTRNVFVVIGQYCHRLCYLEWFVAPHQSADWLQLLNNHCPLERLHLISDYTPLGRKALDSMKSFDLLTWLHVDQTLSVDPYLLISNNDDDDASKIPWPALEKLYIYPFDAIDDTTWIPFIKHHPHLKDLCLENAARLTNTSLDAMAKYLPDVAYMTMVVNDFVTPETIRRWVSQAQSLVYLRLDECEKVKQDDFPELAKLELCDPRDISAVFLNDATLEMIRQDTCNNTHIVTID